MLEEQIRGILGDMFGKEEDCATEFILTAIKAEGYMSRAEWNAHVDAKVVENPWKDWTTISHKEFKAGAQAAKEAVKEE